MVVYVIGDIHGDNSWIRVYDVFRHDNSASNFIFLGDLIDQRDKAYNIEDLYYLHLIRDVIEKDKRTYLCLGNHDVARILNEPTNINDKDAYYKRFKTDHDFRTFILRVQAAYKRILRTGRANALFKIEQDKWLFSHAGLSYLDSTDRSIINTPVDKQVGKYNTHDISPYWTRRVDLRAVDGYNQVVGHTPIELIGNTFPVEKRTGDGHIILYVDDSSNTGKLRGIKLDTETNKIKTI
jgi:hypothetical protein